jgi:hypothetical protein
VFFNISGYYSVNAILRVKSDGGEPTVLKFPDSGGRREWHGWHIFVDSSGLISLVRSGVNGHTLIHLSSSGEVMSQMDLSLSKFVDVISFAVQPDGRSLFLGSFQKVNAVSNPNSSTHKPPMITDIPSLFWLDTTGKIAKEVPFGKEISRSVAQLDGLVTAGKPGIFYLATRSEIKEYGAAGDLIRAFPITAPNENAQLTKLQFVDGRVALQFSYPTERFGQRGNRHSHCESIGSL